MMIPQVAGRLLDSHANTKSVVLDPFCGSGTVLVESVLRGMTSCGIDINHLAILVAEAKVTPIRPERLEEQLAEVIDSYNNISCSRSEHPNFFNLRYWFKPKVIRSLARLRKAILLVENARIKKFLYVALSETIRDVSNTRTREFKLFRMSEGELSKHEPNVIKIFKKRAERNIAGMRDFVSALPKKHHTPKILKEDTRLKTSLRRNSVDLIVTSPPYGDSRTTVAYGQFSRLSLQWLGLYQCDLDKSSLGGRVSRNVGYRSAGFPTLRRTYEAICELDPKRALEVLAFFVDLEKCLIELNRVLRVSGHVCMVLGNRTVKGQRIPTDQVIVELASGLGWQHEETIIRSIPNKRMPSRNSPENIKGKTGETMTSEYIVVMRKSKE